MRVQSFFRNGKTDEIWPLIRRTIIQLKQFDNCSEAWASIMDGMALAVGSSSTKSALIQSIRVFCMPVMRTFDSQVQKKPRDLKKSDSTGSTGSADSLDLAALDCLTLVPKSDKKNSSDIASDVPSEMLAQLEIIRDHTFYRQSSLAKLKVADKFFSDPQSSQMVRTVFGAPMYAQIRTEMKVWLNEADEAEKLWNKASNHIMSCARSGQVLEDYIGTAKSDIGDPDGRQFAVLKQRFVGDSFISLGATLHTLLDMERNLLDDDDHRDIVKQRSKLVDGIKNVQEAASRHIINTSERAKVTDRTEQRTIDAAIVVLKDAKEDLENLLAPFLKMKQVTDDKEAFKQFKALQVWIRCYLSLRCLHLEHLTDFSKCFGACERNWKEMQAIEAGDGKWLQPGSKAKNLASWLIQPFMREEHFTSLSAIVQTQRNERTSAQSGKTKVTYAEFVGACSCTVIKKDYNGIVPEFPSDFAPTPKDTVEWVKLLQDTSDTRKPDIRNVVGPVASLRTEPEKHAAWFQLDMCADHAERRRSAMTVALRLSDTLRSASTCLHCWFARDNEPNEHGSLSLTFDKSFDIFSDCFERLRNVEEDANSSLPLLKEAAKDGDHSDVVEINTLFLPFVEFYPKAVINFKCLLDALRQVAGVRMTVALKSKQDELKGLYMDDWESKLNTSVAREVRIKTIIKGILAAEPLKKHQMVEAASEKLMELVKMLSPHTGKYQASGAVEEAKMQDTLSRRYLAAIAMVQWSCCRKMQHERGSMGHDEFIEQGNIVLKSVKDLHMYEPTKDATMVVPADIKQEFDRIYEEATKNE